MTRGKIQFIEKDGMVYTTLEFNGDMYPSGNGHEIIMHFKKGGFTTKDDYDDYVMDFDRRNFGYCNYKDEMVSSLGICSGNPHFTFNEHYTDYLYIVNASGSDVTLQSSDGRDSQGTEVILPTDKMAIVHYYQVEEILERESSSKLVSISEKEYNGFLYDQMSLLEDIKEAAESEGAVETLHVIERKFGQVERKLHQQV